MSRKAVRVRSSALLFYRDLQGKLRSVERPRRRRLRDGARNRFVGHEGDGGAVMSDVERGTLEQGVAGLPVVYRYLDAASSEEEAEGQAGESSREPGCEA